MRYSDNAVEVIFIAIWNTRELECSVKHSTLHVAKLVPILDKNRFEPRFDAQNLISHIQVD
jgi:hypothetical protein